MIQKLTSLLLGKILPILVAKSPEFKALNKLCSEQSRLLLERERTLVLLEQQLEIALDDLNVAKKRLRWMWPVVILTSTLLIVAVLLNYYNII